MTPFRIRIAAHDAEVRGQLREAAAGVLLGEEREAAAFSETHIVARPKGPLVPETDPAAVKRAGSFVLIEGVADAAGLARRVAARLRLIQRAHTLVLTREG